MEYVLHIAIMACIYCVLASSLDLIVGRLGILSIAHGAFYGVGAYTSALCVIHWGIPFVLAVIVSMIAAAAASAVVSGPAARLRGHHLVVATFAFQMIAFGIFNNWISLTGGAMGISGIPAPDFFGWTPDTSLELAVGAVVLAGVAQVIVGCVVTSPFGRVLAAIREDELFARACGKNTAQFKVIAFALSSGLAGASGALYAHYVRYIDATSFTPMESILILSMVVIGGAGSLWGPVLGAVVLVVLPELLRFLGLPATASANLRQVIYGTLLIVMMVVRPRGFLGRYGFYH